MEPFLQYMKYIIIHKYRVWVMCFRMWLYWQWLVHDLSKLLPDEFIPYMNHFYIKSNNDMMEQWWIRHIHRNKHHWNYWVIPWENKALPMPEKYIKEMLCDWRGMGRQWNTDKQSLSYFNVYERWEVSKWYQANKNNMVLHEHTREYIENHLDKIWLH